MNNTLSNGFRLLELLSQDGGEYSVKELSGLAGLPPSHVCRLLKTLVQAGYLEQRAPSRKYQVSLKLLELSQARLMKLDLRLHGHCFVVELGPQLKAPVFLSAPCQGRSIVVDVTWPTGAGGDPVLVVGQVHSIRHSACGKVCAAFASNEERALLDEALSQETPPLSPEAWEAELARIRVTGLAVRREDGLVAVAAPIFRAGGVFCGAIGTFFSEEVGLPREAEGGIRRTARAISFALGQPVSS